MVHEKNRWHSRAVKNKKATMDYSINPEERFEEFLTAKRAKGVVDKIII